MNILDLLFPKACLECGTGNKYICEDCLNKMRKGRVYFTDNIFSIWNYHGVIRKAIIKLKYNYALDIASELAEVAFNNLDLPVNINFDNAVLVPIPLHKRRENWRGFNQAEEVGKLLSMRTKTKFEHNLLSRVLASKPQVKLDKKTRLRNISGKFTVNNEIAKNIDYKKLIIVFDDVVSTRATLKEAIKVLKKTGFKKVYGLALCSS